MRIGLSMEIKMLVNSCCCLFGELFLFVAVGAVLFVGVVLCCVVLCCVLCVVCCVLCVVCCVLCVVCCVVLLLFSARNVKG